MYNKLKLVLINAFVWFLFVSHLQSDTIGPTSCLYIFKKSSVYLVNVKAYSEYLQKAWAGNLSSVVVSSCTHTLLDNLTHLPDTDIPKVSTQMT